MRFWPATEPAQCDYERLREVALAQELLAGLEAERFRRGGLAALIRNPASPPARLIATWVAVPRPHWSPYCDPRLEALADAYELISTVALDPMECERRASNSAQP
ncbi:MAG: hypothetical protein ACYCYK_14070 [Candidatus Dormibacteria bacterium]